MEKNAIEYLNVLQKEYIDAEYRSKFYIKEKDRNYWVKVTEGKKLKIKQLGLRLALPTLLDNEVVHRRYYNALTSTSGFPNFSYTRKSQFERQHKNDLLNYYFTGSSVIVGKSVHKVVTVYTVDDSVLLDDGIVYTIHIVKRTDV